MNTSLGQDSDASIWRPAYAPLRALISTRQTRGLLITSIALSLLGLVLPLYMAQIFDRVMTSQSLPTLAVLTLGCIIAAVLAGAFDYCRTLICGQVSLAAYLRFEASILHVARQGVLRGARHALADLEIVRGLLLGPLPAAIADAIFAPLFLALLFAFDPRLGLVAAGSIGAVAGIALLGRARINRSGKQLSYAQKATSDLLSEHAGNLDTARIMGFSDTFADHALSETRDAIRGQTLQIGETGMLAATGRSVRQMGQVLLIALTAFLVVSGDLSAGSIIVVSIVYGRMIGPLDQVVSGWRMIDAAMTAAARLLALHCSDQVRQIATIECGRLGFSRLELNGVCVAPHPEAGAILRDLSLTLLPGELVGLVGPSGSGKSSLLRALGGAWPTTGIVRINGDARASLSQFARAGEIGYMPQQAGLFSGTVADNIRRFDVAAQNHTIVAAGKAAGAHAMIMHLPQGYHTEIGVGGQSLSSGQRQRIALARALFNDPALVLLDEPDAGLDGEGDAALDCALDSLRKRGAVVVVATHRASLLSRLDKIIVVAGGKLVRTGPANEVLSGLTQRRTVPEAASAVATR